MRIFICLALIVAVTASPARIRRGLIHQEAEGQEGGEGESLGSSGYHHEVEHEHAKSHQTIKFQHFHPVPVYIKKEHAHLLKHPLEKGSSAHNLKQIHPKTEQHHSYGLVLENHGYEHGIHGRSDEHEGYGEHTAELEHAPEQEIHEGGGESGGLEGHGFGEQSEHAPAYESQHLQEEEHYQYGPVHGGYEAEGHEGH